MFITHLLLKPNIAECITANDKLVTAHSWVSDSLKINGAHPKRYLWRLDRQNNELIIISKTSPNKIVLGRYGDLSTLYTSKYHIDLAENQTYNFVVYANPTKRNNHTHRIEQLTNTDQQKQWLIRKATSNGFVLKNVNIDYSSDMTLLHNQQFATKIISVEFSGQLSIDNETLFKQALLNGIGREKAYGLGLLLVKPVK